MSETFNQNEAETGQAFYDIMSSFWLEIHKDKRLFKKLTQAYGDLIYQQLLDTEQVKNSLAYKTAKMFRTQKWYPLSVRQSAFDFSEINQYQFGKGLYFSDTTTIRWGQVNQETIKLRLPDDVYDLPLLSDSLENPKMVLVKDIHYAIRGNELEFFTNPLLNENAKITRIFDEDGNVIDREITLYAYNAKLVDKSIYNTFGILLGLKYTKDARYEDLVKASMEFLTSAGSYASFVKIISALFNEPYIKEDYETITEIVEHYGRYYIATSKNTYILPADSSPVVNVGDTLPQYSLLSNGVQILDNKEKLSSLPSLLLDGKFLDGVVSVPNETKYIETLDDLPFKGDKQILIDNIVNSGVDLQLPKYMNALDVILSEIGYNLIVIRVNHKVHGNNVLDVNTRQLFNSIIPSHKIFYFLWDVEVDSEVVGSFDGEGDTYELTSGSSSVSNIQETGMATSTELECV